jgi:hypothetical protein
MNPDKNALAGSVVIAAMIAATYAAALHQGRWPPSHPWSGIALGALAVTLAVQAFAGDRAAVLRRITAVLALIAAGLWLASALLAPAFEAW